ncbi:MAG: SAM-dependent methyltransferase [Candidatus Parabeggiatoa sp. nov. 3]|nr:MAG: SAM-dependent methyltransferase [Gammaproteobacteria bacterium]
MSFGKMPLANGFLAPEQFDDEYFFELKPAFCENCLTFQIIEQPNPEKMFHDSYAFFSRTSKYMVKHFQDYAEWAMASYFESDRPFVVEIGSNDGVMLENFANKGIKHLGIEPSANVAKEAQKYGVNTIVEFFNAELANRIIAEHGQADAILAANVMCHIPNLHSIAEAVDKLLKLKGVLIFEDPYLGDMIEKTSYDQIYDEHVYIFSAHSVINIFKLYGLELIDVKPQITHGGSMRYVFARQGQRSVSVAVAKQLTYERNQGLHLAPTFEQFRKNCEQSRERLVDLLNKEKAVGHRVVGYAATSKSTTVLNYCAIGSELIEFISDTTPIKQGKYSPGAHIPVRPYAMFTNNYPDAALLFAWNHKKEIMEKETAFTQKGGQWLTYVDV